MVALSTTTRPVAPRLRSLIVAVLLALSLLCGVAGTAATVSAKPPKQPPVSCVHWTQEETILILGFDPGPTGYWNCDFVPVSGGRLAY